MANLNPTSYESKYNNGTTGLFKTNTTFDIGSDDLRTFVTDTKDSFLNKASFQPEGYGLVLQSGTTYNFDFNSQYKCYDFLQISVDTTIEDADNPLTNAIAIIGIENTSGASRSITFSSNSRYIQNGDATGSQSIDPGTTASFLGFVDSSGLIHWSYFGSQASGGFTVGDQVFNPGVDQEYDESSTYESYTQSGAIAITSDLVSPTPVNGSVKIYQIVGDGSNITFDSGFVNSDDGSTAVSTINYSGAIKIYTYYDQSIDKVMVDVPLLGGGGVSALNDLSDVDTTTGVATTSSRTLRVLGDLAEDGTYERHDWSPGPNVFTKRELTASDDIEATDIGTRLYYTGSSTITLNCVDGLEDDWWCLVDLEGTGQIDFSADTTINSKVGSSPSLDTQWTSAEIRHNGSNVFVVTGEIS
jgi:hypothetical protein